MVKTFPDKFIRKAIFNLLDGTTVDGKTINCFDSRLSAGANRSNYYLMSLQTNLVDNDNKCDANWQSDIRLECVSIYQSTGNTGSRLMADNMADNMRNLLSGTITLDPTANLTVNWQKLSNYTDLVTPSGTQIIYRKIAILDLYIQ